MGSFELFCEQVGDEMMGNGMDYVRGGGGSARAGRQGVGKSVATDECFSQMMSRNVLY